MDSYLLLFKDRTAYLHSPVKNVFTEGFNAGRINRRTLFTIDELGQHLTYGFSIEWIAQVISINTKGVHLSPFQDTSTFIFNNANRLLPQYSALLKFIPHTLQTDAHIQLITDVSGVRFIDSRFWTPELATHVCTMTDGFKFIPKQLQTDVLVNAAILRSGCLLYFVRHDLITDTVCRTALLSSQGCAMAYIPGEFQTPEILNMAVEINGKNLLYISTSKHTADLVNKALQCRAFLPGFPLLKHIRPDLVTYEVCMSAIHRCADDLQFIPKTLKITDTQRQILWRAAIVKDGTMLRCIPSAKRTLELCRLALENTPRSMRYVPLTRFVAEEREQLLDSVLPDGFRWIPAAYQTEARAIRAVTEGSPHAIVDSQSADARTQRVLLAAVQRDPSVLMNLKNPAERTPALLMAAVQRDGTLIKYILKAERTPALLRTAVRQTIHALKFIHDITEVPELYMEAVQHNGLAIQFIREKTLALMIAAVRQNPRAIEFIRNPPAEVLKVLLQRKPDPLPRHVAEAVLLKAVADGDVCGITYEPIVVSDEFTVTRCGHAFKRDALNTWYGMGKKLCPKCNQN